MSTATRLRVAATAVMLGALAALAAMWSSRAPPPIKVGVLHSLTGTMALNEQPVVDATLLAIEELNRGGGLLGRPVEAIVANGASDPETFAREAERLIRDARVTVLFGCWTSASRKAVKPVVERHNVLLFYPVQYEGLEMSPNIVYTGAAPNQQIIPGVKWCLDHLGRRFFLVGSDYVFPRSANRLITAQLRAFRAEVLGEEYVPLGSDEVGPIVAKIKKSRPDVIINTINGDANIAFFRALRGAGVKAAQVPTMSLSLDENLLAHVDASLVVGDYATWSYFQSVETPENNAFIKAFRNKFGANRVTSAPMEAAYIGVRLWAKAVRDARSPDGIEVLRRAIGAQSIEAPEGVVSVDPLTQHCWKVVRVGRIAEDRQFEIVWSSKSPVEPVPFPSFPPSAFEGASTVDFVNKRTVRTRGSR